ncbi:F-box/WD repeat-containing protein 7-like [Physella acuta]|uniref:F-box/WD repeat-containing protein 7-like n=1 Tax=Physella acuta TaxID=109671 RepID=UPI0027DC0D65|nr:F-box/WD repeat-containing protein 7-like [Physella acuta]
MNAIDFLTSHRKLEHKDGVLPPLTDMAVQSYLDILHKGDSRKMVPWRGMGGVLTSASEVEFDQQMDKILLWLEGWSHQQRCRFLEKLLRHSPYPSLQFVHTALQPSLHRDFMYTVRSRFPEIEFSPVSTYVTRELKDRLRGLKLADGFYREQSAYMQKDEEAEPVKFPPLLHTSFHTQPKFHRLPIRRHIQIEESQVTRANLNRSKHSLASNSHQQFSESSTSSFYRSVGGLRSSWHGDSSFKSINSPAKKTSELSQSTDNLTFVGLPEQAEQILMWYSLNWSDGQRTEFLHKLVLSLDPRQMYFISRFLAVKLNKDIVSLLPETTALRVLSHLSPRDLLAAAMVCKRWNHLASNNDLWKSICQNTKIEIPVGSKPSWKDVYRDNYFLRRNWDNGRCKTSEFLGHTQSVQCVACDLDHVVSGSADKTLRVWDIRTGQLQQTLTGHTKTVFCVQFYTKILVVSGSFDNTIKIWNLRTGEATRTILAHDNQIWCLKVRGNLLASGSQDKTAKLWNIGRSLLLQTFKGHSGVVFGVDISEDSQIVITSSGDGSVRLWNRATGQSMKSVWVDLKHSIMSVSYSHRYFVCAYDRFVCLYKDGNLLGTFEEHRKRVESVKLKITDPEKGEGYFVTAGQDGLIKYWNIQQEESVQTYRAHSEPINNLHVDDLCIASASSDHTIRLYDFNIGRPQPKRSSGHKFNLSKYNTPRSRRSKLQNTPSVRST